MEVLHIKEERFKKLPIFNTKDCHMESNLYISDNMLYKIYHSNSICGKEEIIETIEQLNFINNCAFPKYKIYINGIFRGIAMDYYNEYHSINSDLYKSGIEVTKKVKILKSFLEVLKQIHDNKLIHTDINPNNVIINDNEAILVDMDSSIYNIDNFEKEKSYNIINSITVSLSYLYNVNFQKIIGMMGVEYLLIIINQLNISKELKNYLNCAYTFSDMNEYIKEYLNEFNEENINYDKNHTLKSLIYNK